MWGNAFLSFISLTLAATMLLALFMNYYNKISFSIDTLMIIGIMFSIISVSWVINPIKKGIGKAVRNFARWLN